jgi:hypothetical protein
MKWRPHRGSFRACPPSILGQRRRGWCTSGECRGYGSATTARSSPPGGDDHAGPPIRHPPLPPGCGAALLRFPDTVTGRPGEELQGKLRLPAQESSGRDRCQAWREGKAKTGGRTRQAASPAIIVPNTQVAAVEHANQLGMRHDRMSPIFPLAADHERIFRVSRIRDHTFLTSASRREDRQNGRRNAQPAPASSSKLARGRPPAATPRRAPRSS